MEWITRVMVVLFVRLLARAEQVALNTGDPLRDSTTLPLVRKAVARGLPLFGICRGIQEINVALGGSLHPYLRD